jgi:hypothetical protein
MIIAQEKNLLPAISALMDDKYPFSLTFLTAEQKP